MTAIGITHPLHRRKIKNEIARLHLPDGLPDFKPNTLDDWLSYLRLSQYLPLLHKQNYKQLSDIMDIAWEDLEDIGIARLGKKNALNIYLNSSGNNFFSEHGQPLE